MKNLAKLSILALGLLTFCSPVFGQVSITSAAPVTENFDTIGTSATATLPSGWRVDSGTPTLVYGSAATATTQAAGTTGAGVLTGTSVGGTYNFANGVTGSSTDRAVGWLTSGSYSSPRQLMVQIVNNTPGTLTGLTVNFDIEKYRSGTNAADIQFFSSTDGATWGSSIAAGNQTYAADANNTTVFNPPSVISKSVSITGLAIPPGGNFFLRWQYTGAASANAQALGIDNVSLTATLPGVLQFSSSTFSAAENSGTMAFTISRVGGSVGPLSAQFSVFSGFPPSATIGASCAPGVDLINPGVVNVNFADADVTDKTVNVTICDDLINEGNETFGAALFGSAIGGSNPITATILENDLPPTLGTYSDRILALSDNAVFTPSAPPTGATAINVKAANNFKGILTVNPVTGAVSVTNAHNEGNFVITVTATGPFGTTTATFNLLVSASIACGNAVSFIAEPELPTGANPVSVAVGDFNADDKQDLATANSVDGTVSIEIGDGAGGFTSGATVALGVATVPTSIAAGDFNNDGKQDLAVTNSGAATVSILTGDGIGGFTVSSVAVGSTPVAVAVGDLNNDGNADLAVANAGGAGANRIVIELGNGNGTFTAGTPIPLADGDPPNGIAIADFNNNGNQDIATSNTFSIIIQGGAGNGTFSQIYLQLIIPASAISVGDLNNDGFQDFVVGTSSGSFLTVGLNDGTGTGFFSSNPVVGINPTSVSIGDFNLDTKLDIIAANQGSGSVSYLQGDGSGGFTPTLTVPVTPGASGLAIGDFNGDKRQDFAVGSSAFPTVAIRMGNCFFPTAANATISGRVTAANGMPIRNAYVTVSGGTLMHPITAVTGSFGAYKLEGVPVGQTYLLTVGAKRYTFAQPNRVVGVKDDIADFNFVAEP
jgi:hypothetical protein